MKKQQFTVWKRNFKKAVLALGIGLCVAGVGTSEVLAAQQTGTAAGHPLFDNHFEGTEVYDSSQDTITKRKGTFAAKYDPRQTGMVTAIEDQGQYNTCWAFSTIAAIEGNILKKGYEDSSLNLSENHLAYFFYNRQTDKLGNTAGDSNFNLGSTWAQNGGTLQGTALALTTWSGVVKETTSEDNSEGAYEAKALSADQCYRSDYRVKNVYFYNYNVDTIKQAITDYGAVASGIYMDIQYWNLKNGAYYCPLEDGNHAIAIVGWDDTYSRDNFKSSVKPSKDGAWLVKNSYGTTYQGSPLGDNGYMWVSYEDASLTEIVAFDVERATESYDNNYQYDGTGNPMYCITLPSGTTYANVFKVKAASGYNEVLKAVSVDVMATDVSYNVQIYTGLTSASKPTSGKAVSKQSGQLVNAGYNRITLNTPVTLAAGEYYSVVITLYGKNNAVPYLASDVSYMTSWIAFTSNVGKNQSFVKYDGKWQDLGTLSKNPANLRIKAYTDNTTEKTTYKLSKKTLGISKGSSAKLSLNITPSSVNRKVTWSSSNKKVATVSSSGKIKAKSYGTATIKAKFVAGGSTKTLKCKVTVGPSKVKSMSVKGGKKKLTITWKRSSAAQGYAIYYSKNKNSGYKKLTTVKSGSTTKYTKSKMKKGTYYVKMCPYIKQNGKTLYGSFTGAKKVTVK